MRLPCAIGQTVAGSAGYSTAAAGYWGTARAQIELPAPLDRGRAARRLSDASGGTDGSRSQQEGTRG